MPLNWSVNVYSRCLPITSDAFFTPRYDIQLKKTIIVSNRENISNGNRCLREMFDKVKNRPVGFITAVLLNVEGVTQKTYRCAKR